MLITLYTDGACKGNPGPGGYGCILSTKLADGRLHEARHSGGFRFTTNNRMELAVVIYGLLEIKGSHDIEVVSDSKYVCDAFNEKWIYGWKKSNWKNGKLLNMDMWATLYNLVSMHNSVKFTWIKGHDGHRYNEECDRMAVAEYSRPNLDIDQAYENSAKGRMRNGKI